MTKLCVKDGNERWCACVKDVVSKMVCERWCLTKWCVKDGVCDKVVCQRCCESQPRTPPGGSVYCACHTKGKAAPTRAAAPPEGSVYNPCFFLVVTFFSSSCLHSNFLILVGYQVICG